MLAALGPAKGEAVGAMLEGPVAADDELSLEENPSAAAFVACIGAEPVGLLVADRSVLSSERVVWLKANFDLERYVNMDKHRARNQAVVTAAALNPIFSGWSRFFFKEAMRLYGKSLLYYESDPAGGPASAAPQLVLQHMVPVRRGGASRAPPAAGRRGASRRSRSTAWATRRRRRALAALFDARAGDGAPGDREHARGGGGGSAATSAFLEELLFTPHLHFSSVSVVHPTGLPAPAAEEGAALPARWCSWTRTARRPWRRRAWACRAA